MHQDSATEYSGALSSYDTSSLVTGLCARHAQTDHLELQVWDKGNSTGQFPARRALLLCLADLLPCHLVAVEKLC